MRKTKNIKPEIMWSVLRNDFTPGFEAMLQEGVTRGWYDTEDELSVYVLFPTHQGYLLSMLRDSMLVRLTFLWIAVPYLQKELDNWAFLQNVTARRKNKNKVLPHGIPHMIMTEPSNFQTKDFKVCTTPLHGCDLYCYDRQLMHIRSRSRPHYLTSWRDNTLLPTTLALSWSHGLSRSRLFLFTKEWVVQPSLSIASGISTGSFYADSVNFHTKKNLQQSFLLVQLQICGRISMIHFNFCPTTTFHLDPV